MTACCAPCTSCRSETLHELPPLLHSRTSCSETLHECLPLCIKPSSSVAPTPPSVDLPTLSAMLFHPLCRIDRQIRPSVSMSRHGRPRRSQCTLSLRPACCLWGDDQSRRQARIRHPGGRRHRRRMSSTSWGVGRSCEVAADPSELRLGALAGMAGPAQPSWARLLPDELWIKVFGCLDFLERYSGVSGATPRPKRLSCRRSVPPPPLLPLTPPAAAVLPQAPQPGTRVPPLGAAGAHPRATGRYELANRGVPRPLPALLLRLGAAPRSGARAAAVHLA